MKVSLNHIRFYQQRYKWSEDPVPDGIDRLVENIGAQLGAVEEVIDYGKRFEGVLIVKVVSCVDHPDADRLHLCKVDDGGKTEGLERDEQGYVQVVCGAPNVRAGMLAAWLPPGSTVPSTFDKDPFVLESRAIRGQISNGMMASPKELGIGDSHEGILEADEEVAPGTPFTDAYNLNGDVVLDIENKMFTHRPDCFGMMGVAREIAGIQQQAFTSPDWYVPKPEFPAIDGAQLPLRVSNELPELVPRFSAIAMSNIKIGPSPVWMQINLARLGVRPINNIVDQTNYFMLLTGQPLHAYDYDKVKALSTGDGATIVVRNPKPGEKIELLNGKTIEPRPEAIMIATDKQLIGIGGVMGGGETEVDDNTRNIILECANFDMYSIRRTSMAHGLFTDAVSRFNKGQSPLQNLAVLAKIVDDVARLADGKVVGEVVDDCHISNEALARNSVHPPVTVSAEFVNVRLGLKLSAEEMKTLLTNVEFEVEVNDEELTVKAPFWRTDIELREDVVEEIGRLYGFDKLPLELPRRDLTPVPKNELLTFKQKVRQALSRAGANEVLTYSFVHGNLLAKAGQDTQQAFRLGNALSPDLQYYRLSLTPSLLDKVHPNIKAGYDEFALFEMGKTHEKDATDEAGLPTESEELALVYAAKTATKPGAAFYEAKRLLTELAGSLGIELEFTPLAEHVWPSDAPYALPRTAIVSLRGQSEGFGVVGEFTPQVAKQLKLPAKTAGFEISLQPLLQAQNLTKYRSLSRFPKVEQDICLKVSADLRFQELQALVQATLADWKPENSAFELTPLDIFQREDDTAHQQITFRVAVVSYERTLTDAEVNKLLEQVAMAASQKFGAERI